jgi:SAM-dependent methyltransferase
MTEVAAGGHGTPSGTWEQAVEWLRSRPEHRKLVLDAYYDDPLEVAADRYWRSAEWQAVRAWLPPSPGQALDVGAGRGIASYALARDGFQVTALEPDGSALVGAQAIRALASASGLPIDVHQRTTERLPFDDASFDLVFARAVLHHTRDMAAACAEFLRVLRPGGRLVAIREHVVTRHADLPAFFAIHPLHRLYGGENAFLLDEYRSAIERAGFTRLEVLAPLRSPINYAPHDQASLQGELAQRVGRRLPGAGAVLRAGLRLPGAWPLARALLERVDHRPGRLYSFIAVRP